MDERNQDMRKQLMNMLESRKHEMIRIRRHLHENPELSFQEEKTAQYIANFYKGKDCTIQTGVGGGYGIVVTIKGSRPGKTIGLRADFDALPIQEETGLPFQSKNQGVMHACGHDGHTAYLMVLADCLIEWREHLPGTIKIIHQPAEETPPGGAKGMLESGLLSDLDAIFGIHLFPNIPTGVAAWRSGYTMAGRTFFQLHIQGKGGHGSTPHLANDAIVAGSHFVTAVQTIVSRRLNPFDLGVVTIGSFDGKGSFNVIKDSVQLEGDVRYMTPEVQELIGREMHRIVDGLEVQFGVKCRFSYTADYPPVYNDPGLSLLVKESLESMNDPDIRQVVESPMLSGSEDFSYFAQSIPGAFFFIGCRPKDAEVVYYNHHPKFDIDEDALLAAAKAAAQVACHYFEKA
jgi:amidohydrolase